MRYEPAIRPITPVSFLRAAEPFWGCAGNCGVLLSHMQEITLLLRKQCVSLERATGLAPPSPSTSSGEPQAFPAPFGEIPRGKWDGKLLRRLLRGGVAVLSVGDGAGDVLMMDPCCTP